MQEEYTSLRDEILQWQEYRFLVLGFMIALVGAMLGFELGKIREYWAPVTVLLLFLMALALLISWYAGDGNMKIAAYLFVFHEQAPAASNDRPAWESRLQRYTERARALRLSVPRENAMNWKRLAEMNLNRWIALAYFCLSLTVLALPWMAAEQPRFDSLPRMQQALLALGWILFLAALIKLWSSDPKARYIKQWGIVRDDEQAKATRST